MQEFIQGYITERTNVPQEDAAMAVWSHLNKLRYQQRRSKQVATSRTLPQTGNDVVPDSALAVSSTPALQQAKLPIADIRTPNSSF